MVGGATAAPDIPNYTVAERLGAGGFGEVFRARHVVIEREVAIKVLHAKYSTDPDAIARFVSEARAVNRISHPSIVEIFDFGQLPDGRQYCVMELVRGRTLRDVLRERGRIPLAEALPVLRGIAEAIDAVHAAGIAHRDLKPDNVFVLDDGRVKLIDFGLAKLTHQDAPVTETGAVFGTPIYMSPEQCRGKAVTPATDAYSFGVLAYQVLAGEPPFTGEPLEIALHHLNDTPELPSRRSADLTPSVDDVVSALLAKDPDARPRPLAAAVDAMASGKIIPKRARAPRWIIAVALVAVTAAVAVPIALRDRSAAPRHWTSSELPTAPRGHLKAPRFSRDGQSLIYRDDAGAWRQPRAGGAAVQLAADDAFASIFVSELSDGRVLLPRNEGDSTWIWLEDPRTGSRKRLVEAEQAVIAPDDDHFAYVVHGNTLFIDQLTAHAPQQLTTMPDLRSLGFSTDSKKLVWKNGTEIFVADIAQRTVRPIGQLMNTNGGRTVVFTGPATVLYCARSGDAKVLQEVHLDTGHTDVLTTLDPDLDFCSLDVTRDGRHALVSTWQSQVSAGVIALDAEHPTWRSLGKGGVVQFTTDGAAALVVPWPDIVVDPATALRWSQTLPGLSRVPLDGTAPTSVATCPHALQIIRDGAALRFVAFEKKDPELVVSLLDMDTCRPVDQWTLLASPQWSFASCGGPLCAMVRIDRDKLVVQGLRRGTTIESVLAKLPLPATTATHSWVAVSPDGAWIAVTLLDANDEVYLVPTSGGTPRTLRLGPTPGTAAIDDRAANLTWASDSSALYVFGARETGSSLTRLTLDGKTEELWSSTTAHAGWAQLAPNGALLGGFVLAARQTVTLLDR